jgi:hypothetical protein
VKWCNVFVVFSFRSRWQSAWNSDTHQISPETWGYPSRNNSQNWACFRRWCNEGHLN